MNAKEAAKIVCADDFIQRFPDAYKTEVKERGGFYYGKEWQGDLQDLE